MAEPETPPVSQPDSPVADTTVDAAIGVIPTEEVSRLQGTRVDVAPTAASRTGEPLQEGHKGKATVRTRYPVTEFVHGVEGVPPVTALGVEVGPSKVDALLEAARTAGTELEVVS